MAAVPAVMRAAAFAGEGRLEVVERPVPSVGDHDQALVRVEVCGICGTDLRFLAVPPVLAARPGVVLGHEYVGEVVALSPDVRHLHLGDRVAVMPDLPCGVCRACLSGRPNLCENVVSIGGDADGGFAHYALAPAHSLVCVPADLPADEAAFVELLSCVTGGVQKAALLPGETALIIGAGPAGLTYLKALRVAGAGQIIVAEVSPWRSQFALQAGADRIINPRTEDLGAAVRRTTADGAEVVVDAVGSCLHLAIAGAARAARIIVFGEDARATSTVRPYDIQHRELRILGSFIGCDQFPRALQMLQSGALRLSGLITHRTGLDGLAGAIAELASGRGAKGMCYPWQ